MADPISKTTIPISATGCCREYYETGRPGADCDDPECGGRHHQTTDSLPIDSDSLPMASGEQSTDPEDGVTACWPWAHRWTRWQQHSGEYISTPGPMFRDRTPVQFTRRWQERVCRQCGKVQQEEMR